MSFLGRLFGTEKALTKAVDSVSKGLDALVYTDQEQAEEAAKDRSEARKMIVEWMRATQGQNLARRLIALSITGVWLSQYIASQIVSGVAVFSDDKEKLLELSDILKTGAGSMDQAVMLILGFYFAAPYMGDFAKALMEKKK
jgi:hypothetical protein